MNYVLDLVLSEVHDRQIHPAGKGPQHSICELDCMQGLKDDQDPVKRIVCPVLGDAWNWMTFPNLSNLGECEVAGRCLCSVAGHLRCPCDGDFGKITFSMSRNLFPSLQVRLTSGLQLPSLSARDPLF